MIVQVALRNKTKESATILDSSVLGAYNKSIKRYNPNLREVLGQFGESEMQLTGSSSLMLVPLLNLGLRNGWLPKDTRLTTRPDLEKAISRANDFLSGVLVDVGLNLVTPDDGNYQINPVFANSLAKDLKKVGVNLKNAKLIPYNILTYEVTNKSPEGLILKLSKEGKDTAKKLILNMQDFSWNYLPDQPGLFGACLVRGGYWGAGYVDLACSDRYGGVVVISGEATSQKFLDRYASNFKKDRDEAIRAANSNYQEAVASLRVE